MPKREYSTIPSGPPVAHHSAAAGLATAVDADMVPFPRRRAALPHSIYGDIIQFVDFISITLISIAVAYIYHIEVLIAEFDYQLYASAGIIGATGLTALLRRDGYYEFDKLLSAGRNLRAVLTRWAMVILALIAFAFTLKISEQYSRFWLYTWGGASIGVLASIRIGAAEYLRRETRAGGAFGRRIAIIGEAELCHEFRERTRDGATGASVVRAFTLPENDKCASDTAFEQELATLEALARHGAVDDVLVAPRHMDRETVRLIVNRLSDLPVSIAILSSVHWLDHLGGEVMRIGGAPALRLYRRPLEGWGGVVKTVEDRILGAIVFVAALPLMLACTIALRFQGPGPIFFVQKRHGFNNEVFHIYKFRTMTVAEDGDVVTQARKGDMRVTRVGAFLRKWSLDELPQLINVMKGEMSLIGPRPHALAHNDAYARTIENYSGRHKVKPGITGWAQVNGLRGETSEREHMAMRVRYDLEYIDNWSLWFDLKVLVMTVAAVLFPKNAY